MAPLPTEVAVIVQYLANLGRAAGLRPLFNDTVAAAVRTMNIDDFAPDNSRT